MNNIKTTKQEISDWNKASQ